MGSIKSQHRQVTIEAQTSQLEVCKARLFECFQGFAEQVTQTGFAATPEVFREFMQAANNITCEKIDAEWKTRNSDIILSLPAEVFLFQFLSVSYRLKRINGNLLLEKITVPCFQALTRGDLDSLTARRRYLRAIEHTGADVNHLSDAARGNLIVFGFCGAVMNSFASRTIISLSQSRSAKQTDDKYADARRGSLDVLNAIGKKLRLVFSL